MCYGLHKKRENTRYSGWNTLRTKCEQILSSRMYISDLLFILFYVCMHVTWTLDSNSLSHLPIFKIAVVGQGFIKPYR